MRRAFLFNRRKSLTFLTHIPATAANYAAYQQKLFRSVAIMTVETTNSGGNRQNIKEALKILGRQKPFRNEKSYLGRALPCSLKSGLHYRDI